jgi:hypothetical protein
MEETMPPPISYTINRITKQWDRRVTADVVTMAVARLDSTNMGGGSAPGAINPPGWGTGACPTHHNRGHLIGNALGGPGNDPSNLVTLTAGTNHPFMYEFEDAVKRYVTAHPGSTCTYKVECDYDGYERTAGFPIPGASGNPFCLFPAPAMLRLSLWDGVPVTLWDLTRHLANPPADLGSAAQLTSLLVYNGGYKLYTGATHLANSCWSVEHNAHSQFVQDAATAYAQHLGHLP